MNGYSQMRDCITQFCSECRAGDIYAIGNCDQPDCALYPVRPNRSLQGHTADHHEEQLVKNEVIDDLELRGLKEKSHVPL
jgi:hypothetical protein